MDASPWAIEHVTTGGRLFLQPGDNTVGRHSSCKLHVTYDYLSRMHVNLYVDKENVVVKLMKALNGVYVNDRMVRISGYKLTEGDQISLGVEPTETPVPRNHAVFVLKRTENIIDQGFVISDDEDTLEETPGSKSSTASKINDCLANNKNINDGEANVLDSCIKINDEASCSSTAQPNRILHMPMLPEVKKEILQKTTEDVREIFGEDNETILDSMINIAPYVCNKLHNNLPPSCEKICNGDIFEISENNHIKVSPVKEEIVFVDSDDEDFAMSQAVLQEMKEEMAYEKTNEIEDLETNETNAFQENPLTSLQFDDDDVIVIEDDDEDLLSSVAGWSSKLLSQNVMSQYYPLSTDGSDEEDELGLALYSIESGIEAPIVSGKRNHALRINSSSSSEDEKPNQDSIKVAPITRRCSVRLKSIGSVPISTASLPDSKDDESVSKSQKTDRKEGTKQPSTAKENSRINKLNRSDAMSEAKDKTIQNRRASVRLQSMAKESTEKQLLIKECLTEIQKKRTSKRAQSMSVEGSTQIEGESVKTANTRLLNRSKSVYIERPLETDCTPETKKGYKETPSTENHASSVRRCCVRLRSLNKENIAEGSTDKNLEEIRNNRTCKRAKSMVVDDISVDKASDEKTSTDCFRITSAKKRTLSPEKQCGTEHTTPIKILNVSSNSTKQKNVEDIPAKLRMRSKSVYIERPYTPEQPAPISEDRTNCLLGKQKGPALVEAPHLPRHKGKLRGVSAVNNEKQSEVLKRQRHLDRSEQMKAKWLSKPTQKKKNNAEIKEKRKEQLRKLSKKSVDSTKEIEKCPEESSSSKKKVSNVKVSGNCNRGAFLTETVNPPPSKVQKLNNKNVEMPQTRTAQRAATIESFSQVLNAIDANQGPPVHYCRPKERKEAYQARNQRTCNRVTFADMEKAFQSRPKKKVRFNDKVNIIYIDRVEGAIKRVMRTKDTTRLRSSTYAERREWALTKFKTVDYTDQIMIDILRLANKFLQLGSAELVAESKLLLPIPMNFNENKDYRSIFLPLMQIELLSTIERSFEISKSTFKVKLQSFFPNKNCFVLVTNYEISDFKKMDLYTLRKCEGDFVRRGHKDDSKETFASLQRHRRISATTWQLTFQILNTAFTGDELETWRFVAVKPIVDNLRVELGAFNGIYHIGRSPLVRNILNPNKNTPSLLMLNAKDSPFKGIHLDAEQVNISRHTYHRLVDDSTPSITLIQGPPGTGKSSVISNISLHCMYGPATRICDRKILICAHSNTAVDNIAENLLKARRRHKDDRFHLLRYGVYDKMGLPVRCLSLQHLLNCHLNEKRQRITPSDAENLRQQQNQIENEMKELRRRGIQGTSLEQQLQNKEKQIRQIRDLLEPRLTLDEELELSKMYIRRANIVCTTLSSCVKLAQLIDYFDACIIDEATQCTEPWTLLPLRFHVRGLVLVGDTQQLPATVLSQKAADLGLCKSMFDRIERNLLLQTDRLDSSVTLFKLKTQYRMHPEICKWPNKYFYENQLLNWDGTANLTVPIIPYCVINLSYTRDKSNGTSRSICNDDEAKFVAKLLVELDKLMPTTKYKYGVITPYLNHCSALQRQIPTNLNASPFTVDSYQGLQKDVIILSNARTRGVGFLKNYQRLNVAITRPRRCLIICGNFTELQNVEMWRHLINDARERNVYFSFESMECEMDLYGNLISKILVKSSKDA